MPAKSSEVSEPFGSTLPFAEPSWYGPLGHTSPYFTDSHRRLRAYCRKYVDGFLAQAQEWEESGEVPASALQSHAEHGFTAASCQPLHAPSLQASGVKLPAGIPLEEWDNLHGIIMGDELMRLPLGVNWGLGGGNGIGGPPIANFASEELKKEILPHVYAGRKRLCLGVTEPSTGSDVAGVKTTASLSADGEHYVVNGSKKWITNGVWADYVTAVVRTGGEGSGAAGISVLVIPTSLPGVERRLLKNSGVNASGSTLFTFDEVKVPRRYLLGKENQGFRIVMTNFNAERLALAVAGCRMARTCIADAFAYATKRQVFGKPLITQPVIQAKFADMGRRVEALQAWIEALAHQMNVMEKRITDLQLGGQIALLKVEASLVLELCSRESQQVLGGLGYQRGTTHAGARIEQISRDIRVITVGGGSAEISNMLGIRIEMKKSEMLSRM